MTKLYKANGDTTKETWRNLIKNLNTSSAKENHLLSNLRLLHSKIILLRLCIHGNPTDHCLNRNICSAKQLHHKGSGARGYRSISLFFDDWSLFNKIYSREKSYSKGQGSRGCHRNGTVNFLWHCLQKNFNCGQCMNDKDIFQKWYLRSLARLWNWDFCLTKNQQSIFHRIQIS